MAESRCDRCRNVLYQCRDCLNIDQAMARSLRDSKPRRGHLGNKAKQAMFRSTILKQFVLHASPRDGHCLFFSIAAGHQHLTKAKSPISVPDLRRKLAEYLVEKKGQVDGAVFKDQWFKEDSDGQYVLDGDFAKTRNSKDSKKVRKPQPVVTLDEYARNIVMEGLYGGDLEIALLAEMLDVTIFVYSCFWFDGHRSFSPEVYGRGESDISLLFEQDFGSKQGGRDHYDLICDKFSKWRRYQRQMPVWNTDIGLCNGSGGRGIKALRDFEKGEAITFYDGHRVDEKGNVVILREAVKELLDFFGVDPEAFEFRKTHAVCLGRVHVTGLMIDGYPLTLPQFDDVVEVNVGRGALANSASPKDSNTKLVWVDAPDLPVDPVDNLRNCEAVLVARRRIHAGEEILWHYALHKMVRIRLAGTVHDLDTTASSDSESDSGAPQDVVTSVVAGQQNAQSPVFVQDVSSDSSQDVGTSRVAGQQNTQFPLHVEDPMQTNAQFPERFVAEDESEDSCIEEHSHAPGEDFKVGARVLVKGPGSLKTIANVTGRIVTHTRRNVQKYVVALEGSSQQRVVSCSELLLHWETDDFENDDMNDTRVLQQETLLSDNDESSEQDAVPDNESGAQATELMGRITCIDVAKMTANDIWEKVLSVRELRGGMLLRSILIAAATDAQCLPLWPHGTAQEKRVQERKLQGIDFVQHFSTPKKLDWLRVKLFSVVSGNRNTYQKLRVTYNGCTSLTLSTVSNGIELTPALRCRIALMALDADCVKLLLGSRDSLERTDNKQLQGPALWEQLTHDYVNNRLWQPSSDAADSISECKAIDTTVSPPSPGLDSSIVQDVFIDCRSDWTRLKNRVFGSTGCNSTGVELLRTVWSHYINGKKLHFVHKEVTMFVFATWLNAGKNLPELCNRQLPVRQQLVLGVTPGNALESTKVLSPISSSGSSVTPRKSKSGSAANEQSSALHLIASVMQSIQSQIAQPVFGKPSADEPAVPVKRGIELTECPDADADLQSFLVRHKISKWWPDIHNRLGITSIEELRYIGKANVLTYLSGLPALPVLKLSELAEERASSLP